MIITAIKAAAFIAFLGITVGLMRPSADQNGQEQQGSSIQQGYSGNFQGTLQET